MIVILYARHLSSYSELLSSYKVVTSEYIRITSTKINLVLQPDVPRDENFTYATEVSTFTIE